MNNVSFSSLRFNRMVQRLVKRQLYFRPVDGNQRDWQRVKHLMQAVYVDELGALEAADTDQYDLAADVYLAFLDGKLAATIRFIDYQRVLNRLTIPGLTRQDTQCMLPMHRHFPLDGFIPASGKVFEASRLIVLPEFRNSGLVLACCALTYFTLEKNNAQRMFSFINYTNPAVAKTYFKTGWQPLAEPFYVEDYKAPSRPLMITRERAAAQPWRSLYEDIYARGLIQFKATTPVSSIPSMCCSSVAQYAYQPC